MPPDRATPGAGRGKKLSCALCRGSLRLVLPCGGGRDLLGRNFSRVSRTVLHYTGSDDDRGGVMSVLRALAGVGTFACVLGVNPGFVQRRTPSLAALEFPRIDGEVIGWKTFWRARAVARAA